MFARPGVDSGPILGIAGMKPWAIQRCKVNPEYGAAGYLGYDIASSKNGSPASKIKFRSHFQIPFALCQALLTKVSKIASKEVLKWPLIARTSDKFFSKSVF